MQIPFDKAAVCKAKVVIRKSLKSGNADQIKIKISFLEIWDLHMPNVYM
jgi:hypothetical protein